MLKKRRAKNSNRGVYIQDSKLGETLFQPGTHFKYVINQKTKELLILPSEEGNTVSKRNIKTGLKPVIDIRKREVLENFSDMDYLEVEIFEDKIIVRGLKEEAKKDNLTSKLKNTLKKIVGKSNLIDINERLELKQKFEITLSKKELQNAVGHSFQQMSIFDILESTDSSFTNSSSTFKQVIDNAKIPLQVASLFSGAGIFDIGFKELGYELVFALERNHHAAETYRFNLGNHISVADVNDFDLSSIPKAPVMIMGIPCTPYAASNRSQKRILDHPDFDTLKRGIESIQKNENAKLFCIENVPQILTVMNGAILHEILDELSDFEITYGVLNSASFGAAQQRKRAFIVGSKIGKIEFPEPTLESHQYLTVEEAFRGLTDETPNQLDFTKPRPKTLAKMKYILPGENWLSIPDELKSKKMQSGKTHSSIFRRLEWDKPSISLPNVRKSNIMPPVGLRSLSVRECARLFGVPDDFIFLGPLGSKQLQICNGVPLPFSRLWAYIFKKTITQYNIRNGFEKFALV